MAVHNVTQYNYQFHGGENGYQGNRAVVRLKSGTSSVGYIYFKPEGNPIPADQEGTSWIKMYMPESAITGVIDMLRNEKPIQVYFAAGSAFLRTGNEPVGEEE
jgi:hypothetical protein